MTADAFSTPWLTFVDSVRVLNIAAAILEVTAFVLLLVTPGFRRGAGWIAGGIALCCLLMSVVLTEVMRFGQPVGSHGRLWLNTAGVAAAGCAVVFLHRSGPDRPRR